MVFGYVCRDKDGELARAKALFREQEAANRKTLEDLKAQVDKNSLQLFDDMKQQV